MKSNIANLVKKHWFSTIKTVSMISINNLAIQNLMATKLPREFQIGSQVIYLLVIGVTDSDDLVFLFHQINL